jgi:hypothetical protein
VQSINRQIFPTVFPATTNSSDHQPLPWLLERHTVQQGSNAQTKYARRAIQVVANANRSRPRPLPVFAPTSQFDTCHANYRPCVIRNSATPDGRPVCCEALVPRRARQHSQQRHAGSYVAALFVRHISDVSARNASVTWPVNRLSITDPATAPAAAGAGSGIERLVRSERHRSRRRRRQVGAWSAKQRRRYGSDRTHIEQLNRNPSQGNYGNDGCHLVRKFDECDYRRATAAWRRAATRCAYHPLIGLLKSFRLGDLVRRNQ